MSFDHRAFDTEHLVACFSFRFGLKPPSASCIAFGACLQACGSGSPPQILSAPCIKFVFDKSFMIAETQDAGMHCHRQVASHPKSEALIHSLRRVNLLCETPVPTSLRPVFSCLCPVHTWWKCFWCSPTHSEY